MTPLALVTPCDRCHRYRCPDRASCDEAYIALLEERVRHWQGIVRVSHERARLDSKAWQELHRGGRGRLLPREVDA